MSTASRNSILSKLSSTKVNVPPAPYAQEDFKRSNRRVSGEDPTIEFVEKFTSAGGVFVYTEGFYELVETLVKLFHNKDWTNIYCWNNQLISALGEFDFHDVTSSKRLDKVEVALTTCEGLVCQNGSVLYSSNSSSNLGLVQNAHTLITVAFQDQLFEDRLSLLRHVEKKYLHTPAILDFVTGPTTSTHVEGQIAHGAREMYLFLMENE